MAGDLKLWVGSDVPIGQSVKFERKGGWFITKVQAILAAIFVVVLIIAAVLLTKYFTEEAWEAPEQEKQYSGIQGANIHPISYELLLNHNTNTFSGEVSVVFSLINASDVIALSFMGEEVSAPKLQFTNRAGNKTHGEVAIKSMEFKKDENKVIILVSNVLEPKYQYNLTLSFIGYINPEETGVFVIPYKYPVSENAVEDRNIIGARLTPGYCGLVFPCIDDITERTAFKIKILKPQNISSVSNTIYKASREMFGTSVLELDDYEWTPLMPYTSLSYVLLPDYEVKPIQATPVALNIWYPPHLENTTQPIAEAANSAIVFFNDYFNSSLPIERLSIVVVDGLLSDYPGNLGVILISSSFLYSPEYETFKGQEELFYLLARKICNQWFGNIAKFKSATDSWIENGLALYLADLAAAQGFSSYDTSTFMTLVQEKALDEEIVSRCSTMKTGYIPSPYKGAFIFHMLSTVMKSPTFKNGLQQFLKQWSLKMSEPTDLWDTFNTIQDEVDVLKFIKTWEKSGYPMVSVDYYNNTILVEQVPFYGKLQQNNSLWMIPITYTSEADFNQTDKKVWLKEEKKKSFTYALNNSWIILNPYYAGLFRTNYSEELWERIVEHLKNDTASFQSSIKAQLIDDSFSLARFSLLDYSIPLDLSMYLQLEKQMLPWLTIMKHLNFLSTFFIQNDHDYSDFKMYLERLMGDIYSELDYSGAVQEKPVKKYLRAQIFEFSCYYNLTNGCNKWAEDTFTKWINKSSMTGNIKILSPELRRIAYCNGNKMVDINSTAALLNASRQNINEPHEEFDILQSLTCTSNQQELRRILEATLDVNNLYFSAKRTVEIWLSLQRSPKNSLIAFDVLKSKWPYIITIFQKEKVFIKAILEASTLALTDEEHLDEVKKLKVEANSITNNDKSLQNDIDQIIEKVKFNVNWKKNNFPNVRNWIRTLN